MRNNRIFSFSIIILAYALALVAGIVVFQSIDANLWVRVLVADIVATLVIYLFSVIFKNASIYDPYWSVQPIIILGLLMTVYKPGIGFILLFIIVLVWGVRLTVNWIRTFSDLTKQDWRYDYYQEKGKGFYPLINLFGIHLFPTIIVFACILPAIYYLPSSGEATFYTFIGLVICLLGIALEHFSDIQMHSFKKQRRDSSQIIRVGLWKYSRHPNYLGEILMWWGVYVMSLAGGFSMWYLGLGALLNTLMFIYISIPLAEKHMAKYKTDFLAYKKQVRKLI